MVFLLKRLSFILFRISFLWLFIIVCETSYAQEKNKELPEIQQLENGLKVIYYTKHDAAYSSIQILIGAGSVTEGVYGGTGITHFIEHLLFKGTQTRQWDQIARQIESFGGYFNASTTNDYTMYYVTVGNEYLSQTLEILADILQNPLFLEKDIEDERKVVFREMSMRNDRPESVLLTNFWQTAYREHPYKYPVIGFKERLSMLTRDDIVSYYSSLYLPENSILIIAGDYDIEQMKQKVNVLWEKYDDRAFPGVLVQKEPAQLGPRNERIIKDVRLGRLLIGFHTTSVMGSDMYPLDVLASILGSGKDSRLHQILKEQKGLVYSISAASVTPRYPGVFVITAVFDPDKEKEVIQAIEEQLEKVQKELVTEKELQTKKNSISASYVFGLEKIDAKARNYLTSLFYTGNINYAVHYVDKIHAVTTQEIQNVALKYFRPENKILTILSPLGEETTQGPSKEAVNQLVEKKILDNGAVLLLHEDHSLPIVILRMVMKGGLLVDEADTAGIGQLLARTWTKGTENMNQGEIAEIIGSVGGNLSAYSGNNSFGLTIKVLSEHTDLALNLFFDVLLRPTFPEEELLKEKKVLEGIYESQLEEPLKVGSLAVKELLFGKHPYGLNPVGTPQTLEKLSRHDVTDCFDTYRIPENTVFGLWGDFSSGDIIQKISDKIAMIPGKGTRPVLGGKSVNFTENTTKTISRNDQQQTIIFLGFLGSDMFSEDRYVLDFISMMLSGQGSVLFEKVRKQLGAAYFVGASNVSGLDPDSFIVYTGTTAQKQEEVTRLIFEELKRLQDGAFSDEEVSRARNMLIWQRRKQLSALGPQSMEACLNELYGLGFDNGSKVEKILTEITAEQIQKTALKYFAQPYVLVIVKPEESNKEGKS